MIKPELLVPQVNTVGLVAHYKLWAGLTTAGDVFDYSLNGNTGTVTGTDITPVYPGFSFNGTDDFIDVGNQGGTIMTMAMWVNAASIGGNDYPLDINGGTFISIESGEIVDHDMGPSTIIYVDGVTGTTITAAAWHLMVVTTPAPLSASDIDIGRVEGQGLFTGKIGDTMLFDRVLDATDVKRVFGVTRWRYGV